MESCVPTRLWFIEEKTVSKELSRRNFLERIGWGAAAGASLSLLKDVAAAKPAMVDPLPSRTLGRTGAKVSILAFGCGSRFLMYQDEDRALEALNRAIDRGITYLDTGIHTEMAKASCESAR